MSSSTENKSTPTPPTPPRNSFWIRLLAATIMVLTGYLSAQITQPKIPGLDPPASQQSRSSGWAKVAREHLEAHPVCEACGTSDNLEVHHVLPFHDNPELELDPKNLITLCRKPGHNCHFVFGHWWNYKTSNPNVREDIKRLKKSQAGMAHQASARTPSNRLIDIRAEQEEAKRLKQAGADVVLPRGVGLPPPPPGFFFAHAQLPSGETLVLFPAYRDDTKGNWEPFTVEEEEFMRRVRSMSKPQ